MAIEQNLKLKIVMKNAHNKEEQNYATVVVMSLNVFMVCEMSGAMKFKTRFLTSYACVQSKVLSLTVASNEWDLDFFTSSSAFCFFTFLHDSQIFSGRHF